MTATQFVLPRQVKTNVTGIPYAGAQAFFYQTGTQTIQTVYQDFGLTVEHDSPVLANDDGYWPVIWLNSNAVADYQVRILSANGVELDNIPNVSRGLTRTDLITILDGLFDQTPGEVLLGITPVNKVYPEGDIRRYGAVLTTDAASLLLNNTAIQTALNVSDKGGVAAYIPPGTWAHTTTISIPSGASLYGVGQKSILAPNGCDGLTFQSAGNILKSRYFRDFQIIATNGATHDGILVNFSAASGNLVSGVYFQNLTIQNFGYGAYLRGLWMSSFSDVFMLNCYGGYYFHGQNVFNRIEGGEIQASGTITGSGDRIGINIDSIAGESTQSLHVIATQIDAYDIAVSGGPMLYNVFENMDIAFCNKYGFSLAATSGNTVIRDCAIQTSSASFATIGVNLADLGAGVNDKLIVEGNWITAFQANAGSIGVYVGTNQQGVAVRDNTIGSSGFAFVTGLQSNGLSHNLQVTGNTIYATTTAIQISSSATDVCVHENTIQNGTPLQFNSLTPVRFSYRASGSFTATLTAMTGATTGTVTWLANGHNVSLSIPNAGISGTSNATTLTLTGLPQYLWPVTTQSALFNVLDSGVGSFGVGTINPATGVITFKKDANGTAFTASGSKGLNGLCSTYAYA